MSGSEYPKAIYRDGGAELVWGDPIETSAVTSADEEKEALAKGWRLHPVKAAPVPAVETKRSGRPPKSEA